MNKERRRYFRIDEAVGISYKILDSDITFPDPSSANALALIGEQDERINTLLNELQDTQPAVAELVALLNLKLERVASQLIMDNQLVNRIAHRVREANISACGIGFVNDDPVPIGARLALELKLYPDETHISTQGRVINCDSLDHNRYYWRIDFIGMTQSTQENLIQHVVRNQSAQLKSRGNRTKL